MKVCGKILTGLVLGALFCGTPCAVQAEAKEKKAEEEQTSILTILGQNACAPAGRQSLSDMSEAEYDRNRQESQRLFSSSANVGRSLYGAGIGMETFGDAFGASSSNRYIEIVTPGRQDVNGTLTIIGNSGTLSSNLYQEIFSRAGTWTWIDNDSSQAMEPAVNAGFSGTENFSTNGSAPQGATNVSFLGNGFSGTADVSFDVALPSSSSTVSATNINASALSALVNTYLSSQYSGATINQTLNSSSVHIATTFDESTSSSGSDSVQFDTPNSGEHTHDFTGTQDTTTEYAFSIPVDDFASFVYAYTATYDDPEQRTRVAMPHTTLGRIKITENFNPLPMDRLIFDYSFFHNVGFGGVKNDVHRFTPGVEKTFFKGLTSVELRIPMGISMDSNIRSDGSTDMSSGEFGDVTLIFKGLLIKRKKWLMSAGLSLSLPTADDTYLYNSLTGQKLMRIKNESCHIMPFVAFQYTPNQKWYAQLYYQIDADADGSGVYDNPELGLGQERLRYSGKIKDMTYQYVSASIGRWVYRNERKRSGLTAMNVVGELHWTKSLDRGRGVDIKGAGGSTIYRIDNGRDNCDLLNATIGTHMIFNRRTNLGIAYAVPLTDSYKQFDGELRATLNYYF